jgi:hypothetical protein
MIVNNIVNFYFFRVIQHYLYRGTQVTFDDEVFYSCLPIDGGPTFRMGENTGENSGRLFAPGTFMDLRSIIQFKKRQAFVIESGYTFCFAITDRNAQWQYIHGTDLIIPSNTHAFVASGGITFEDKGSQREAKILNLVNRRPYELKTVGQSELILIP